MPDNSIHRIARTTGRLGADAGSTMPCSRDCRARGRYLGKEIPQLATVVLGSNAQLFCVAIASSIVYKIIRILYEC